MRIAVSGTHFSGKSTLIAALVEQLPNYVSIEEPYLLLQEEGYEFSNPPSVVDFEQQLMRSIRAIVESRNDTIFDRCPLDCLAYAFAVAEIDIDGWAERMQDAIQMLDLIVFVPIEKRDRIPLPPSEDLKLRKKVDENLQEILFEDSLHILGTLEVIEVAGTLEKRASIVKDKLK